MSTKPYQILKQDKERVTDFNAEFDRALQLSNSSNDDKSIQTEEEVEQEDLAYQNYKLSKRKKIDIKSSNLFNLNKYGQATYQSFQKTMRINK